MGKKNFIFDRDGYMIKESTACLPGGCIGINWSFTRSFFYMRKIGRNLDYLLIMITNQDG